MDDAKRGISGENKKMSECPCDTCLKRPTCINLSLKYLTVLTIDCYYGKTGTAMLGTTRKCSDFYMYFESFISEGEQRARTIALENHVIKKIVKESEAWNRVYERLKG